jgi:hypothetical protein
VRLSPGAVQSSKTPKTTSWKKIQAKRFLQKRKELRT